MHYTYLLFDLDDTVLDFQQAQSVALSLFLSQAGVPETELELYIQTYKSINHQLWEQLEQGLVTREKVQNTRFSKLFEYFGIIKDGEVLAKQYSAILSKQGHTLEGALPFLNQLKDKGFRLFAASNGFLNIQTGRLQVSGLDQIFEKVFISEALGASKPELAFFQALAADIEGFDPAKALMIGDSLTADIQGAYEAKLDSVWFNPNKKENLSHIIPTYEVQNYEELKKILYSENRSLV